MNEFVVMILLMMYFAGFRMNPVLHTI